MTLESRLAGLALAALTVLATTTVAPRAHAALTTSERGQIRDYVSRAQVENAGRVRALVARTDLTVDESAAALTEALAPVAFTAQRAAFLKELTFGLASASARPLLAQVVVRALCARADAVLQKYVGGLDHEPGAIAELTAIYAFLDGTIANAGTPSEAAHDPAAGLSPAAYAEASKALREHVDRNARWLKGDGVVPGSVGRLRAQAQIALLDLLPDGLTRRVDAVERLGLAGARKQMLVEWGVLLQDAGGLDAGGAERVRQVLARVPAARSNLEVVYAGPGGAPLTARGDVLDLLPVTATGTPFGDELTPLDVDPVTRGAALDVATRAATLALRDPQRLAVARADAVATQGDPGRVLGRPRAPSAEHVLGAAAQLVVLDAARAVDLAFVRVLGGRPESAALLSDALATLAGGKGELEVGKAGGTATTKMTGLTFAAGGAVTGFALDGHTWAIERPAPSYAVTKVTRDAQPFTLAHLATARTPLRDGDSWTDGKTTFTKLRGAPRLGFAPAEKGPGTVEMAGSGARGYDVVTTPAPADDFVLEGDLAVRGGPGGLAFRATNGKDSLRGAMLLVTPSRVALVSVDETGGESVLGTPLEPVPALPVHVKLTVRGAKVDAVVGTTTLSATLPASVAHGDLGIVAKRGVGVVVSGFSVKK